jgi:hypothetical protein
VWCTAASKASSKVWDLEGKATLLGAVEHHEDLVERIQDRDLG